MAKEKNSNNNEPLWKQRRKELAKEQRKAKLWTALVIAVIAAAVCLLAYGTTMGVRRAGARKEKVKPEWGIATIADKRIVTTTDGKKEMVVIFKMTNQQVVRKVDQKEYESVEKGQDVKVRYRGLPPFGTTEILSWQQLKLTH